MRSSIKTRHLQRLSFEGSYRRELSMAGPQSATPGALAAGEGTAISDMPLEVLSSMLQRLDGLSLAAASCSTSLLRSLAADSGLWRRLCQSTWPSLCQSLRLSSMPPHRLFADAFPFPHAVSPAAAAADVQLPTELVSAVDIYYDGVPILSRVIETPTSSPWFLSAPFCIEALEQRAKLPPEQPLMSPKRLELSWIVINPATGRAVNVSSRKPVMVDRHWYTLDTVARFAVIVEECSVAVAVTLSEESGHVKEVSLVVEDADGMAMSGGASLRVIESAINGRRTCGGGEAAARRTYEEFMRRKKGRKEQKARREVMADLCCSAIGAAIILAVVAAAMCRRWAVPSNVLL